MIRLIILNFKFTFFYQFIIIFLSAIFEILSIFLIIPFFNLILNSNSGISLPFIEEVIIFNFYNIGTLLLGSIIISCFLRVYLLKKSIHLAFSISSFLSVSIYKNLNNQKYPFFLQNKNDFILNTVLNKLHSVTYEIILPFLLSLSSIFILLFFLLFLVYSNIIFAFVVISIISLFYVLIIFFTQKNSNAYSQSITRLSNNIQKVLSDNLLSIKNILIEGYQNIFVNKFSIQVKKLRNFQGNVVFLTFFPRIVIESIGLVLIISLLIYLKSSEVNHGIFIPILASLGLASIRLLPLVQQIYVSFNSIRTNYYHLYEIKKLLNLKKNLSNKHLSIIINKSIVIKNLMFFYDKKNILFKNLNLSLEIDDRVLIYGKSGVGKTTFINIIAGLIEPKKGTIFVDSYALHDISNWNENISYVDQSCFLYNGTIRENLFFPNTRPSQKTQDLFSKLKAEPFLKDVLDQNFLSKKVGDHGSLSLSGGQSQKISIIRSLLKDKPINIYDEVTSSLDSKSSKNILQIIEKYSKNKLLIFISHDSKHYSFCNKEIEFKKNKVSVCIK
jgi:ABC-type multidrug transport system fused ATPase/permease subunit